MYLSKVVLLLLSLSVFTKFNTCADFISPENFKYRVLGLLIVCIGLYELYDPKITKLFKKLFRLLDYILTYLTLDKNVELRKIELVTPEQIKIYKIAIFSGLIIAILLFILTLLIRSYI